MRRSARKITAAAAAAALIALSSTAAFALPAFVNLDEPDLVTDGAVQTGTSGDVTVTAGNEYTADSRTNGLYTLMNDGTYDLFTNLVDGYSLHVDSDMTVDMSYSGVCAVLFNDHKRIEIYRQSLASSGFSGYIAYSNKFLENSYDHVTEFNGYQQLGEHNAYIVAWHRDKLARVVNDMNYYLTIDIVSGGYAYTIQVKADRPISELGGYTYLAENFTTFAPYRSAYNRKSAAADPGSRGWNDETLEFFNRYFGDDARLSWGLFEPDTGYFSYYQTDVYEQFFGYEFPVMLNYSEFQKERHPNLRQRLVQAWDNNSVLELTLQTTATGAGNMMYDILQGGYDVFLKDYAGVIADFGHPVLFRLMNEMNGDWCPYSAYNTSRDPLIYTSVYKYIYGIFEQAGCDNVIWIWNPNGKSFPDFRWNSELMYYPGDEYVDIIGLTAYNTGTYYASVGERWQTFEQLYDGMYKNCCRLYGQPFMITEFSCASMGGDKVQWVKDMFMKIEDYDRIKMAVWWDGVDWDADGNVARAYQLDDSQELLQTFRANIRGPWKKIIYA